MCVYTAIMALILAAMQLHVSSAAALKCNGYGLEFSLAGHLDKGSVTGGGPGI